MSVTATHAYQVSLSLSIYKVGHQSSVSISTEERWGDLGTLSNKPLSPPLITYKEESPLRDNTLSAICFLNDEVLHRMGCLIIPTFLGGGEHLNGWRLWHPKVIVCHEADSIGEVWCEARQHMRRGPLPHTDVTPMWRPRLVTNHGWEGAGAQGKG